MIASVTAPFCGDCSRARLTIDGRIVTCLFAAGGADLRSAIRGGISDDALRERIAAIWSKREDRYSEERASNTDAQGNTPHRDRLEMYQIGG